MLWEFVFLNILLIALGVLMYIVIRTLPRLDEQPAKKGIWERWITSEFPAKLDAIFHASYLRTLRRIKVLVLRADNSINKQLESIKMHTEEIAGSRADLDSIKGKSAEEIGEETGTQ